MALDDLRQRFATWRQQEAHAAELTSGGVTDTDGRPTLTARLDAIRAGLAELQKLVDELATSIKPPDR